MLHAQLKVLGGKHNGRTIPLAVPKFLIGREQDCHLRPNSELVSRHHCAITTDEYSVRVRDFGSTNGTFVNGQRVKGQTVLNSGDRVSIGSLEFEIEIHKSAPETVSAPAPNVVLDTPPPPTTDTVFAIPTPSVEGQPASEPAAGDTALYAGDTTIVSADQVPQQGQVPQQNYVAPAPVPETVPAQAGQVSGAAVVPNPPIKLPPPESTGAAESSKEQKGSSGSTAGKDEDNPSSHAADIIRQYRQRRG
jgi:pSer/pThr/pTyr-binding forkhead associated (FHA) protein